MHYHPPYRLKIHLIRHDGVRWVYDSLLECAQALRESFGYSWTNVVGVKYRQANRDENGDWHWPLTLKYEFICRDEAGGVITSDDLYAAWCEVRPLSKWIRSRYARAEFSERHFRTLPVPHTRCYRGGGYSFSRRPKTLQERAQAEAHDEELREYGIRVRPRRNKANLPNSWDDVGRTDWDDRSWKRHRKTQWKEKRR